MLYRLAWFLCRAVLVTVRRMEVLGTEHIPMQGGLVLASNHKSYWDPIIVGCALPIHRQVYFMAKSELFKIPGLGIIIRNLGAFPVRRGGADRSAIRTALELLSSGQVVGIFPEGTRNASEGTLEPHLGAAMLAARTGVPVLPVAIIGSRGLLGKVRIIFGPLISFKSDGREDNVKKAGRADLVEKSGIIMDSITGLMKKDFVLK